ncbi:hypothetical protein [Nocardioides dongxiaopingii]|uniref:hypothetical protein n=1 Tax=Nocardioides dongxiaopingii TaxID=2576036 RepID=UPI0010C77028|nr:hypothetical protein [Nocardioides dongxiaopingii]
MASNNNNNNARTHDAAGRRISTETKASTKTTELYAYIAAVVAVVITAIVIGDNGDAPGGDSFGGSEAMRYITYLTIGYMIARGLAKAGSRDFYDADRADSNHAAR